MDRSISRDSDLIDLMLPLLIWVCPSLIWMPLLLIWRTTSIDLSAAFINPGVSFIDLRATSTDLSVVPLRWVQPPLIWVKLLLTWVLPESQNFSKVLYVTVLQNKGWEQPYISLACTLRPSSVLAHGWLSLSLLWHIRKISFKIS